MILGPSGDNVGEFGEGNDDGSGVNDDDNCNGSIDSNSDEELEDYDSSNNSDSIRTNRPFLSIPLYMQT